MLKIYQYFATVFIASILFGQAIAEIELSKFQHPMPVIRENQAFDIEVEDGNLKVIQTNGFKFRFGV